MTPLFLDYAWSHPVPGAPSFEVVVVQLYIVFDKRKDIHNKDPFSC
jgi:hypothetical protein